MAINPRISDLSTQLDLSEADLMAVCDLLGIVYRSSHTRVSDTQAENIRRRVERMRSSTPKGRSDAGAPPEQTAKPLPAVAAIVPEPGVRSAAPPVVPSSTNVGVSELAERLGLTSAVVLAACREAGVEARSYASTLKSDEVAAVEGVLSSREEREPQPLHITDPAPLGRTELAGEERAHAPLTIREPMVRERRPRMRVSTGGRSVSPPPQLPPIQPVVRCTLSELGASVFSRRPAQMSELAVTARSSHYSVFVHADFLDWLAASSSDTRLVKRARFVLTEMLRQGFARGTKGVRGAAAGWRRAPLGGGPSGFHYYLWYVSGSSAVGRDIGLTNEQLLVRAVRHHDATDEQIDPGSADEWIELHPNDVVTDHDDTPFTDDQLRIAAPSEATVRTVRGYPGSGKTTALLLSALTAGDDRVLYLTFNHRLVNEARGFLDTFLPDPGRADVLSFESLLEEMADARPGSVQIAKSHDFARTMAETLKPHVAKGFGAWDGLLNELYDELHAHAFGRSLPIDFRGVKASPSAHLPPDQYQAMRVSEGLGDAARDAAGLLRQLVSQASANLFPGPFCARSLLTDVDTPPAPRFRGVGLLLVDEVQDLTPVEVLLVLNLAARIGVECGRLPQLVFAGDESQTVRPTEFEWAWLRDLVRAVLPDANFEEFALDVNLRSPSLLAEVVEATKNQYRLLAKADRPSGQTKTLVDDSVVGRVIYATNPSDAYIEDLLDLVEQTPRSALVYPGGTLPEEISSLDDESVALSAAEAKGLDFETVVVADAGIRQEQLQRLLSGVKTEPHGVVRARSMADQFRVAVSRSTYNLVLVDREEHLEPLENVLGRQWTMPLERVEFADLHDELVAEADDEQLVRSVIAEVDDLLLVNVHRALLRSRSASRRLERMLRLQEVPDELISSVDRVRGMSAALALSDPAYIIVTEERSALEAEATVHLERAGLLEPLSAFMTMASLEASQPAVAAWEATALEAADGAASSRAQLAEAAPHVLDRLDRMLVRWVQRAADAPLDQAEYFGRLARTMRDVVDQVGAPHQYVSDTIDAVFSRWASVCVDTDRPVAGLDLLPFQREVDRGVKARCLEAAGKWSEAIDDYVAAGLQSEAVLCARKNGDLQTAIRLHGDQDDSLTRSLRFVHDLTTLIDGTGQVQLLAEERQRLQSSIDRLGSAEGTE
jgi:hypothetical protein